MENILIYGSAWNNNGHSATASCDTGTLISSSDFSKDGAKLVTYLYYVPAVTNGQMINMELYGEQAMIKICKLKE